MVLDKTLIIFGGFKCATQTLSNTFSCRRRHTTFDINVIDNNIQTILIPFNNDLNKILKSAYFQDMITPSYTYSPFNRENGFIKTKLCSHGTACGNGCNCKYSRERKGIINNIETTKLIEHYKSSLEKLSWYNGMHLNNKLRHEILEKQYNINVDFNSKEIQCFNINIKNKIRKGIYFHVDNINNNFNNLKYEIYGEERPDIQVKNSNVGKKKWYGAKYLDFIKLSIKDGFRIKD